MLQKIKSFFNKKKIIKSLFIKKKCVHCLRKLKQGQYNNIWIYPNALQKNDLWII